MSEPTEKELQHAEAVVVEFERRHKKAEMAQWIILAGIVMTALMGVKFPMIVELAMYSGFYFAFSRQVAYNGVLRVLKGQVEVKPKKEE